MEQITFETLLAAVNTNPSEYEERYVRWVSIGYDKKALCELLYELQYLKEKGEWPERIAFLESILAEYNPQHLLNLLNNDPQTTRFATLEKWARHAAMEILIFDKYSIETLNTVTQFPLADYQLFVKRVQEIITMIREITTQSATLPASGLAGL
jgi:hypothetical protein